ncbi:hypothetical protein SIN8267_02161 [Sinobacterium norvegicum]|uniref:Uncharacterized protein n=1 Tax=Sinobacterium norvegicum TaxID=1641715 RepID=A0ABN8EHZ4_9GAMM|nr:hypothetical protein [Sinobacterium norvegicum]CAH0992046.1 hypothetical protein SIN8267_02161 [Sinobacterium norvegicum]
MQFLCPTHQDELGKLSDADMVSLWFDWMNQAALYYEEGDWQQSVVYSGCSFELSIIYLSQAEKNMQANACKNLSLSAMYCINALIQNNENHKASYVFAVVGKLLDNCSARQEKVSPIKRITSAFRNIAGHGEYFNNHLNFPFNRLDPQLNFAVH